MTKNLLLVLLLAVAAIAAVVSNEVPDVVEVSDVTDRNEVGDENVNEMPEVDVIDDDKLTDVAELTKAADVLAQTAVATRRNLNLGSIASGDILVYNSEVRANGIANHFHVRYITIRKKQRVSAIRVNRVGTSHSATASISKGGIGSSFVTIRIRSATGRGYHYKIQVYVR